MRRSAVYLMVLTIMVLISCSKTPSVIDTPSTHLIVNGNELDVYTTHYSWHEKQVYVPLNAFLLSLGADDVKSIYVYSPAISCIELMGNRFIIDANCQLFMLENDYASLVKELQNEGKKMSKYYTKGKGLIDSHSFSNSAESVELWADIKAVEKALMDCGLEIKIDADTNTKTIRVKVEEDWFEKRIEGSILGGVFI